MKPTEILNIEKLVHGGQALAHNAAGETVFVWNALPGEEVEVEYIKRRQGQKQAAAIRVVQASPDRIEPIDHHFLSSSPWQMMNLEAEDRYKRHIAAETYSKIGDLILNPDDLKIVGDGQIYGYRNKMEFSFTELDDGTKSIALFERGKKTRIALEKAAIASDLINETAQYILSWVNEQKIPMRSLKSLIVRSVKEKGEEEGYAVAALFIKDRLPFEFYPALTNALKGFQLYYSTHKSPASVPTDLLYETGQSYLEQDILGTRLRFGLLSFFQINPPVFELALKDIAAFLEPKKPLLDFYAGVGAISLPLAQNREKTILVESNQEAVDFARHNIEANSIRGGEAHCFPAEKLTELIEQDIPIVLDPPRAGLHQDVVKMLLKKRPPRIIYLSCNISTQARDMRLLAQAYKLSFMRVYNFFPRTPHIEGLVVLER